MDYFIRDAQVQDARALAEIYTLAWQFAYEGLMPQNYLDSLEIEARVPFWKETLLIAPAHRKSTRRVALDSGGAVLGVVSFGVDREGNGERGEIYTLYARPSKIGQGIGFALLAHALEALTEQGFESVILWVLEGNELALKFYERQGFRLTGRVREEPLGDAVLKDLQMLRHLGSVAVED